MTSAILVDGSNVLFWRTGRKDAAVPELVVRSLIARRFIPVVYFDHSISQHMDDGQLDRLAMLAEVAIASRGTPADALLLGACEGGRIQIVSCDRFAQWRAEYPNLRRSWLVTGRVAKGGHVSFSRTLCLPPI